MSQLLAGAGPFALTKSWFIDGTATDVGAVTIGVIDGNGDELVASGTATTNNTDGTYSYSLASVADPDDLKIVWTRTDTGASLAPDRVELVGNLLFTENQARTFAAKADATSALIPLASSTEYPDAVLADERTRITDDFEQWTGRSWIPRYCRLELPGNGGSVIDLDTGIPRTADGYRLNRPAHLNDVAEILTVTVGGTAVTASTVKVDTRRNTLRRTSGVWTAATTANPWNVVVEYVYGMPNIVNGADRTALLELVDRLVPSAWPDRVLSADTEFGTTRFVQPGGPMGNRSRVPRVNDWVKNNDNRVLIG